MSLNPVALLSLLVLGSSATYMQNGQTYICDVDVSCICGGGEDNKADPRGQINYRIMKDGVETYKTYDYAKLPERVDTTHPEWERSFEFKYDSSVEQQFFLNLWDVDGFGNADDFLAETDWFHFNTYRDFYKKDLHARYGGEMSTCDDGPTSNCHGRTGWATFICQIKE